MLAGKLWERGEVRMGMAKRGISSRYADHRQYTECRQEAYKLTPIITFSSNTLASRIGTTKPIARRDAAVR